ncbi:hypothetical protein HGA34_01155 [Candidatus Falkowbacteria bacterium]|nr:hypothetical protein [Candidatus Falkowbacteria bacterium]
MKFGEPKLTSVPESEELKKEREREGKGEFKFWRLTQQEKMAIIYSYSDYGKSDESLSFLADDSLIDDAVISQTDISELQQFDLGRILEGEAEEERKTKILAILHRIRLEK